MGFLKNAYQEIIYYVTYFLAVVMCVHVCVFVWGGGIKTFSLGINLLSYLKEVLGIVIFSVLFECYR